MNIMVFEAHFCQKFNPPCVLPQHALIGCVIILQEFLTCMHTSCRRQYLFHSNMSEAHLEGEFFRSLYPIIVRDTLTLEQNWRDGPPELHRIRCQSESSKGVYCLQYDDEKIVSGLRDHTIKVGHDNIVAAFLYYGALF